MENELYYTKSPTDWTEALPIGNGKLGAMIFGNTDVDRIQLNEDSLWSAGPVKRTNSLARSNYLEVRSLLDQAKVTAAEKLVQETMFPAFAHMRHYQTAGDIWIDFNQSIQTNKEIIDEMGLPRMVRTSEKVENYSRKLDISKAEVKVDYAHQQKKRHIKSFVSMGKNVIVYQLSGEQLNASIHYTRKDPRSGIGASYIDKITTLDSDFIIAEGHNGSKSEGIDFSVAIHVIQDGGKIKSNGAALIVEGAHKITLYISVATSFRQENPTEYCIETLKEASDFGFLRLQKQHYEDYSRLYEKFSMVISKKSRIDLPTDFRLEEIKKNKLDIGLIELYFNYSRYLLISSSHNDSLPSNLQGIWNQELSPAWGSKYTININTQMNYWMAEQTGLGESVVPLLRQLKKMHPNGLRVGKEMYGIEGFVCHHNTDIWGDCDPQDNNLLSTLWPTGGAWLCLYIWKHYEYSNDKEMLRELFLIMEDAVKFFNDYLYQDFEGHWITGPSVSPENIFINQNNDKSSLCNGPALDIQIIYELFRDYLKACDVLEINNILREQVSNKLTDMIPIKISKDNRIQEWNEDYDEADKGHRHISQLYALYPGELINYEQDEKYILAAEKTLKTRIENGGGHTGWSRAWIINFWNKLRKPELAMENIHLLLSKSTYPNLLDNHPPFQIDGNFGGAMGILQCFIQEDLEAVLLLPSLPKEMEEGSIQHFRSKHGIEVSFKWTKMSIQEIELVAYRDTTFKLKVFDIKTTGFWEKEIQMKKGVHRKLGGKIDEV